MRDECDKITGSINEAPVEEKYIREILRFGTAKLHNISAYMGGVAAQECVKMLISQYIPINHTLVYDGIHGRGQTFSVWEGDLMLKNKNYLFKNHRKIFNIFALQLFLFMNLIVGCCSIMVVAL